MDPFCRAILLNRAGLFQIYLPLAGGFATLAQRTFSKEGAMPHCSKCGSSVADVAAFCSNCGAPQQAPTPAPAGVPQGTAIPAATSGLAENVAGLLCYVLGWVTGLIFLLIDKRPFVRFHAAQSLVTFGILNILGTAVSIFFGSRIFWGPSFRWDDFGAWGSVHSLIGLVTFVLWIVCMIKAYQHENFRIPIAADIVDEFIGK